MADDYAFSDAMRDLAPHLIRREARASTRLDDCTQNEEETMSDAYTDCFERDSDRDRRSNNQYSQWTQPLYGEIAKLKSELAQALAEKDRAIAQLRSCAASLAACVETLDKIDLMLTVPAAEYVPVIPEVWEVIRKARAALPAEAERLLANDKRIGWLIHATENERRLITVKCFVPNSDSCWWEVIEGVGYCTTLGEGNLLEALDAAMGTAVSGEDVSTEKGAEDVGL